MARLPMGGGAPREVAEHIEDADWGPDGISFAVIRKEGGRDRLEFPIGKVLYEGVYLDNVRVSPRGDWVAFTNHPIPGDNRGDVEVVDLAGNRRTLSQGWADIRGVAWSPDGDEVWFTGTRIGIELNLWGVSLDGDERQIYRAPGSMRIEDVSADGRVLLTVGRTKPTIAGRAPNETTDRDLSWLDWGWAADVSLDGKRVLFTEQGDGGGPDYSAYMRGTDGSPALLLGKGHAFSLSPDGRQALVLKLTPPAHLALLPTGAGEGRELPRGSVAQVHGAAFFADGKQIAISGNEPGKAPRIWVQQIPGGDPVAITPEGIGFDIGNPVSPDGASIVARDGDRLVLYPVSGGAPRPIQGSVASDQPLRFSADGRSLYVRENVGPGRFPVRLFRIDLASGERELWRELTPPGASLLGSIYALAIAPDAGAHAYTYTEQMTTLYEVSGLGK